MKTDLEIGDSVFNSPMGAGIITGVTVRGYPQVNHVAVARLIHKTDKDEYLIFDPHGTYAKGRYTVVMSDKSSTVNEIKKSFGEGVIITFSLKEAMLLVETLNSAPERVEFDHNLEENSDSQDFCIWLNKRELIT
jgi:20S proteasome alpha/beta subunit